MATKEITVTLNDEILNFLSEEEKDFAIEEVKKMLGDKGLKFSIAEFTQALAVLTERGQIRPTAYCINLTCAGLAFCVERIAYMRL